MSKLLKWLDRWMLKRVLREIDSRMGDLSLSGYSVEAYEIGKILTKIERKIEEEKENKYEH